MSDIYSVRRFQNSDADKVSKLIIKTLRTTNIKDYSEEYIENDIKSNPFLNVPQVVTPELLHKYFERFNYKIKVRFEDDKSSMWWFNYEYSNSEKSIADLRDEDTSIKYPSRMKYFRTICTTSIP